MSSLIALTIVLVAMDPADATAAVAPSGDWIAEAQVVGAAAFAQARQIPALFLSLAVLAAIPPLMLAGSLARLMRRRPPASEACKEEDAADVAPLPVGEAVLVLPARKQGTVKVAIGHCAMRIGREGDNDLRLNHGTVHGYHALIEREFADGITITDLSGPGGNGVYINGRRIQHAALRSGDTVALGAAVMRFIAEPLPAPPKPQTLADRVGHM